MNNLIVNAWPLWGMVIAIMSVVYLLWPLKLMKKSEYATFFLCSFSIYWLLMLLLHIYLGGFHHKTSLTTNTSLQPNCRRSNASAARVMCGSR